MILKSVNPKKSINKAYLKLKPNRNDIDRFKNHLISLLNKISIVEERPKDESEEHLKNDIRDFLRDTFYKDTNAINTKDKNDLVIHIAADTNSSVGVIIEAKRPSNKTEMVTNENLNTKAFQELILYYLRERILNKNIDIKHLIITNINEWFVFDATIFERLFAQNKNLVKQFNDFEGKRLADSRTEFFYKQIAKPFIDSITTEIEFTYFNLQEYQKPLRNADKADDNSLIALFKLLSPEHLLKLPFTNDSNSLDKRFYSELLHIIGLTETKDGSKKLIERNKEGERHTGTILENAIIQLDSLDKLSRLEKPNEFGNTQQERLFNVSLELSITWINRILFLKLLEAQLITYHKAPLLRGAGGVSEYKFLNFDKIKNYDDLNSLFFQVLARKYDDRNEDVKKIFEKVPYLNSSLFEPTDIEQVTLFISNLKDDKTIPIFSQTVLKDQQGKKRTGQLSTLQYLFEFLDAYDFGAEGGSAIQEDNKTLINASVLGLIFEKINGYKDGSFFTPGFITMYMCRETIRKAVVQKFNEAYYARIDEEKATPLLRRAGGVSENPPSKRRTIIPYNPKLKELARELRNNSTKTEIILWKELKGKFEGKYDFHRQKPLDNYIADFFCHELKLAIEIDGETHNWEETQLKDHAKESRLNELGLNVLRFQDTDIIEHLDATLEIIRQYIEGYEKGDLSEMVYEDSPLNPLTGTVIENNTPLNPLSRGDISDNSFTNVSERHQIFNSLDDVYEQIGEGRLFTRHQANEIVNSIKICDPAVGSGHFLVSALNEMIAVKNDLKILQDRDGKRLKEYQVEVVNDELIVTDEEGELFEYTPPSPLERGERGVSESQRIQETLFHEKQTIIENCLFGVDINSNSVKICRLRLWIELLKNAYYKNSTELETLPNIDINIKCGNSLVSRFAIDADLKQALKKSKWTIDSYRMAVATYRNAESKEQKREMERLIADIKSDFRSEISLNDPKVVKLRKLNGELFTLTNQGQLFEMSKKEKADWNKKVTQLTEDTQKLEAEIEEIKANKIYENAFEWRFEFPEVLNEDGDFVGFDVVIGNPPYIPLEAFEINERKFFNSKYAQLERKYETSVPFILEGLTILNNKGLLAYIAPVTWQTGENYSKFRNYFFEQYGLVKLINLPFNIFEDAYVDTALYFVSKEPKSEYLIFAFDKKAKIETLENLEYNKFQVSEIKAPDFKVIIDKTAHQFTRFDSENFVQFGTITKSTQGLSGSNFPETNNRETEFLFPFLSKGNVYNFCLVKDSIYNTDLADKKNLVQFYQAEPKILIRRIISRQDRLSVTYCDEKLVFKKDINPFIPTDDNFDCYFLTGIIASKLISFIYLNSSSIATKDDFRQTTLTELRKLPIPKIDTKNQKPISDIVKKILNLKSENSNSDTTDLENQIDQLVYQLYELTEEEIKIIENA